MRVETEDEAAVDVDALRLDADDRHAVTIEAATFPPAGIDAGERIGRRTLQTDQYLRTTGIAHQRQQVVVVGDTQIRLGEPANAVFSQFRKQRLPIGAVDGGLATVPEIAVPGVSLPQWRENGWCPVMPQARV